jgi:hypothetical protein
MTYPGIKFHRVNSNASLVTVNKPESIYTEQGQPSFSTGYGRTRFRKATYFTYMHSVQNVKSRHAAKYELNYTTSLRACCVARSKVRCAESCNARHFQ